MIRALQALSPLRLALQTKRYEMQNHRTTLHSLALALALGLSALGVTADAQPRQSPRQWIETRHTAINQLLHGRDGAPATERQRTAVTRILNDMIDVDELARRALDPLWAQRTPAEQQEFVGLLRQLIEHNYRSNLDHTADWVVRYEAEEHDGAAGTAVVRTVARSRDDSRAAPVTIEYRLHSVGNRWVVYDLVTNNASLVQTYHDSYTRILRERGFAELVRRMRNRLQQMQSGAGPRA